MSFFLLSDKRFEHWVNWSKVDKRLTELGEKRTLSNKEHVERHESFLSYMAFDEANREWTRRKEILDKRKKGGKEEEAYFKDRQRISSLQREIIEQIKSDPHEVIGLRGLFSKSNLHEKNI